MRKVLFLLLLLTAVSGCTLLPSETGLVPTPTAVGDMISYKIPAYSVSMSPGSNVAGTPMRYVSHNRDVYTMDVDGELSEKRAGDSFNWQGMIAPGVFANYRLRLTTSVFDTLPVAGVVDFLIFNPVPADSPLPDNREQFLSFNNIFADYLTPVGREIPGTTMIYDGIITQGQGDFVTTSAKLSSPLRTRTLAVGDSFTWVTAVRDNVYVEYNLRVINFDETDLHLSGTATLWIDPTPR